MTLALFVLAIITLVFLSFFTWSFSRERDASVGLLLIVICGTVAGAQSVLGIIQYAGS